VTDFGTAPNVAFTYTMYKMYNINQKCNFIKRLVRLTSNKIIIVIRLKNESSNDLLFGVKIMYIFQTKWFQKNSFSHQQWYTVYEHDFTNMKEILWNEWLKRGTVWQFQSSQYNFRNLLVRST